MSERYHAADEGDRAGDPHDPCPCLDELLCEYVDGTMDPAVREVFEEYLRANPRLAEHARCLCDTRRLLCQYGCHLHAPRGFHAHLRRRLSCEMMHGQGPLFVGLTQRLSTFAALASAMAVMLMAGMLVGAVLTVEEPRSPDLASALRGTPLSSFAVIDINPVGPSHFQSPNFYQTTHFSALGATPAFLSFARSRPARALPAFTGDSLRSARHLSERLDRVP